MRTKKGSKDVVAWTNELFSKETGSVSVGYFDSLVECVMAAAAQEQKHPENRDLKGYVSFYSPKDGGGVDVKLVHHSEVIITTNFNSCTFSESPAVVEEIHAKEEVHANTEAEEATEIAKTVSEKKAKKAKGKKTKVKNCKQTEVEKKAKLQANKSTYVECDEVAA